jgi:hypothetical protein
LNFDDYGKKSIGYFIWFPFVCFYNILLFHRYLNNYQIILFWGYVLISWLLLYFVGIIKERRSNNPLKGLLDIKEYHFRRIRKYNKNVLVKHINDFNKEI